MEIYQNFLNVGALVVKRKNILNKNETKNLKLLTNSKQKQTFENQAEISSPIDTNINTNEFWKFMQKYKQNKGNIHRFILERLEFKCNKKIKIGYF